jgi:alpha-L-fucosidase 2
MAAALLLSGSLFAQSQAEYSVTWNSPGNGYKDSMPIGNGDIGLNLWTEANGDIVFLIGKTDAWTENGQLVKLGRVRLSIDASPFKASPAFRQILQPRTGAIELRGESSAIMRVWVDANAPVIHIEMRGSQPVRLKASAELWRTEPRRTTSAKGNDEMDRGLRELSGNPEKSVVIEPDTVLPAVNNQLAWLHFNARSIYPSVFDNQHLDSLLGAYPDPLLHRTFGVLMKGPGLASVDNHTLQSTIARNNVRLDLYALTTQTASPQDWRKAVEQLVARIDAVGLDVARAAHQRWWNEFWSRSWIRVSGDANATAVTQGYAMQRWMTATGGRGPAAMKFNGGIFTVGQEPPAGTPYDSEKGELTPDYRAWGSNYWFQNQRLLYWPMIASGDLDTLAPFYKMYLDALPLAKDRTAFIYKHDGAAFPETMYFWGLPNNNDFGWGRQQMDIASRWIRWHVNNGLELTTMMLDTWDVTRDRDFAVKTMLPLATEITTYFDRHWPRVAGKLHFDPSAALETRQSAVNPAPDLAGLMDVLPRLLALPDTLTTPAQRAMWKQMLAGLPPLPIGRADEKGKSPQTSETASTTGAQILWPAEKFAKFENTENPELYSVFPFRIFGVGLPQIDLARATYDARGNKGSTCWGQDGIHAACLGWAARARDEAVANFTAYGGERFKWFWKPGHDYEPDLDNGGAGQMILQSMLLQVRGDKLLLFPAWPKDWNVDFKLHAPMNTVVEGAYRNGKLERLTVAPSTRAKDIVQMAPQ